MNFETGVMISENNECPHELNDECMNIDYSVVDYYADQVKVKGICTDCNRIIELNFRLKSFTAQRKNSCKHNDFCWKKVISQDLTYLDGTGICGKCKQKVEGVFEYSEHNIRDLREDQVNKAQWESWQLSNGMVTDKIKTSEKVFKGEIWSEKENNDQVENKKPRWVRADGSVD